jgi:hypothetical protein
MCAQQTQYDRDIEEINGQLGQLVIVTDENIPKAEEIGRELGNQIQMAKDINTKLDTGNAGIARAREQMHSVSEITGTNWLAWGLALCFLIGTIVVWVV